MSSRAFSKYEEELLEYLTQATNQLQLAQTYIHSGSMYLAIVAFEEAQIPLKKFKERSKP